MKLFICRFLLGHKWRTRDVQIVLKEAQEANRVYFVQCARCGALEP